MSAFHLRAGRRDPPRAPWPFGFPLVALLLAMATIALVFVSLAGYAYQQMGLSRGWFEVVLLVSILGSRLNVPVARFRGRAVLEEVEVVAYGVRYRVPALHRSGRSVLAVNVGGALLPLGMSVYLMVHNDLWWHALITVLPVAAFVWLLARPVPGVGIVVPTVLPPAAAAAAALCVGGPAVAALAYVCGTLGTLIGADLLNLPRIRRLNAPVASIGGAGTFDGIFLTGILAVLLATL